MVHASRGNLPPASEFLRSEPAIVAGMARATLTASKVDWMGMIEDYDRIRDAIESVFPDFADYNNRIGKPGGFRLPLPPTERIWKTESGKAEFLTFDGLNEDPHLSDPNILTLTTIRSHDQYNTTIYGMDDRYRGVFGRRDVLFMNEADLTAIGLAHGDLVDVEALPDDGETMAPMKVTGITAITYGIARGSVAAYYPEMNGLIALAHYDQTSGTPGYKSTPVRITRAA
jgi:anaerobic selenocysteine-containing dehydrogenase